MDWLLIITTAFTTSPSKTAAAVTCSTKIEITTKSGEHLDLKKNSIKAKLQSQERSTVSPQPESKLKRNF
ncbi:CFC_HP_G0102290.mRNA.1.CDS.1 [Saccharomyces cerevisiae]|nr:CFC_HP_G0102290.mRNA.1.CDS.1 [Saccharomyces cerevisiae]CAI6903926.1 CFC_HP_G0102290.mRNA.1.CDS.1 [Saccharomyces cerevisiae]